MQPVLVPIVLALLLAPLAAPALDASPSWSPGRNDYFVTVSDGVEIDATMWVPDGTPPGARLPGVVIVHGYGGSKDVKGARDAAAEGYVGFAYTARGFGASGGQMDIVGPRTILDLKELIAWLKDVGPVDAARVGFVGASYGGGHAMQIATEPDAGLAAVVAVATWSDLEHGLIPNGVPKLSYTWGFYAGGHGLTQDGDAPADVEVAGVDVGRRCLCDTYAPEVHRWFVEGALGVGTDDVAAGLAERSAIHRAANVRVPLFLIQGLNDDLFSGEQAIDMLERVPIEDKRLHLGYIGHPRAVASGPEVDYLMGEVFEWFDHYLRDVGDRPVDTDAPIDVSSHPWDGSVQSLARWPKGEEGALHAFRADGGLAPGDAGQEGAVAVVNTLVAGVPDDAAAGTLLPATEGVPGATPVDTVVFRSGPLDDARTLLGTPRAELAVTPTAPQFMVAVKIFDRAPDGSAELVTRGVFGARDAAPGVEHRLVFDLQPYAYEFAAGHEVEVRVAASDFPAYAPVKSPFTLVVRVGGDAGSGVRLPLE